MSEVLGSSEPLHAAVLFLVFNRPDTTKQVFEAIRQAKPSRLYVAADGARQGREGEAVLVEQVRQIVSEVDWACEVKTLFRENNLGCKIAISSAIDWFFRNEEQGIILEDDCLPNNDFFHFCQEMLDEYRLDSSIGMIAGFNPQGPGLVSNEYFASKNSSIWGWASWRDRWAHYDVGMADWHRPEVKERIRKDLGLKTYLYYKLSFDLVAKKILNTWDHQWAFCLIHKRYKTIKPLANLIKNIGTVGTHAVGEDLNHNVPHGGFSHGELIRNDNAGYTQDAHFFSTYTPHIIYILLKHFLHMTGFYSYARAVHHRLNAAIGGL
jgi:hypothetical protein